MRQLLRISIRFCEVLSFIGAIAVMLMVLLVTYSSFSRYVLGSAIEYMEEVAGLFLMVSAFASFAYVFVKGRHIRVKLILDKLPKGPKGILDLAAKFLLLFYLALFTKLTYDFVVVSYHLDCHTPTANLYEVPWMAVMPFGGLTFAIVVFIEILHDILYMITGKSKKVELEKTPEMEEAETSF